MPSGYACYKIKGGDRSGFPEETESGQQKSFSFNVVAVQDDVRTEIKKRGRAGNQHYEEFKVKHERREELWGRYNDEEFHQIIRIYEFPLFLHENKQRAFFRCKRVIAKEVVNRLNGQKAGNVPLEDRKFDLELLTEELKDITGAWFGNLILNNVSSAALFGNDVETSNEWNRYTETGDLSNIQLDIKYKNSEMKCSISSKGSIVIFKKLPESERLELLDNVLDKIKEIED